MSRPRQDPSYRRHSSGQAVVTLTDGYGGRKDFLLGEYNSRASKSRYHLLMDRWNAAGRTYRWDPESAPEITGGELLAGFLEHAKIHSRKPSGRQPGEYDNYRRCLRPLNHLFGLTLAKDFNHFR